MNTSDINIFIVDDHEMFRDGLKFVLSQVPNFKIIGEASSGIAFLETLNSITPDVVLMDISMPDMDGITATETALKTHPELKVIAITSYTDDVYYYRMIKAGALGFVQKKVGVDELQKAIETVYNGENYYPSGLMQRIIMKISSGGESTISTHSIQLSVREKEILSLICQGFSNNEIGEKLFISPKTVDNHRTNLISKTGTRNSAHLVMFAIKNNLVEF
jgi:DNA-binding NarL/FixJ family response regulator